MLSPGTQAVPERIRMPVEHDDQARICDSSTKPLFLFGFWRSGTTLLQRLLNSYEDVLIWGEHVGFLRDLANAYFRVWRNPDFFQGNRPLAELLEDRQLQARWSAWMNWIAEEDWRDLYRRFLEAVFAPQGLPGKRFWGWKEVHYAGDSKDATLPFLAEIYPHARYIFLVRSGFNVVASYSIRPRRLSLGEWKHEGCDRWRRTVATFRDWHRSGRVESYWIRYEDMIRGEGELLRLLGAMGKRFGADQRAILTDTAARGSSFDTNRYNERWRQLSTLRLGVARACLARIEQEMGYPVPPVPIHGRMAGRALAPLLAAHYHGARRAREVAERLLRVRSVDAQWNPVPSERTKKGITSSAIAGAIREGARPPHG
jgi:hypothetical protein